MAKRKAASSSSSSQTEPPGDTNGSNLGARGTGASVRKPRNSNLAKPPAAKRLKTTANKKSKAGSKSGPADMDTGNSKVPAKPRKNLKALITELPTDILLEVLSHLPPRDLLHTARTDRLFRKTILNRGSMSVWKTSLEAYNTPEPPEDFSLPRWAALLFEPICQYTSGVLEQEVMNVDWYLLKRICPACKAKCLTRLSFSMRYKHPQLSAATETYISSTWHEGAAHFWASDFEDFKSRWDKAAESIDPVEIAAFEKWKKERAIQVAKRIQMVPVYEEWRKGLTSKNKNEAERRRELRLRGVRSRFLELGYLDIDIDSAISVESDGIFSGSPDVTDANLEPTVEKRMGILEDVYSTYLEGLRPSEQYFCPPLEDLRPIPEVLTILEADKMRKITEPDFKPVADILDDLIARYQVEKKKTLVNLLNSSRDRYMDEPLELARNVFRRAGHQGSSVRSQAPTSDCVLVGWAMLGTHITDAYSEVMLRPGVYLNMPTGFIYNELSSRHSSELIDMAGLNPQTASVDEMDSMDPRFVYDTCSTLKGYAILSWRAALCHLFEKHPNRWPTMRLASKDEAAQAKSNEGQFREAAEAWACNHCSDFLAVSSTGTKAAVLEHLENEHKVTDPKSTEDYFINERCRHTYEIPYHISTSSP
ncbi:hypothetical protein DFP72DRAFT_858918 [Ephemerocybe angulata]|uniref:F-box domain-containing protein n=1 Tax=Ephemerocybe angulata TaxID=980116 RepID=A0A8H6HAB9_9AGAR|nr:hypothetical protein DFP72DRAFT_858918 [Tulosesus angulatus]